MQTSISTFNHTIEQSHAWLKELQVIGDFETIEHAYTALRAVLQCLRDRLLLNLAAHLAAQVPLLIKGVFYDGWDPEKLPKDYNTKEEFLAHVREKLHGANNRIDAELAAQAVFKLLTEKLSAGLVNHIKGILPKDILILWQ